ncbi:hypothetical protein AV530_013672 [Patagioenas fasciata monilis]|uniref:Uncharacterized protein n=1 Tax=Patagioenas fasciata monilis TaxID=372326 RepID=A0A1V4J7D5_PATFA|nr:hypothetical protein AV530_013672 [Patagioenas fasciata monilis]
MKAATELWKNCHYRLVMLHVLLKKVPEAKLRSSTTFSSAPRNWVASAWPGTVADPMAMLQIGNACFTILNLLKPDKEPHFNWLCSLGLISSRS